MLGQIALAFIVGLHVATAAALLVFLWRDTRYFHTRTLIPFAIYCTAAGTASLIWLTVR